MGQLADGSYLRITLHDLVNHCKKFGTFVRSFPLISLNYPTMRDRFVRELKKTKTKTGQGGPVVISCWPLFNVLSFITDTVRHKRLAIIIHFQNN